MERNGNYRLADATAVEPLINNWAVWSDLISPVPYSLHMLHYQIKVLSSYLADPEMHVEVCQSPEFSGGPFVNVPVERADEIAAMLVQMKNGQGENIKLAHAVTEFANFINQEATGQSLEPFYEKTPEALRGYVELLYDYHNHPIMRCLESLFYVSPYYQKNLQSLRIFREQGDNSRPPFLSTPRLPQADQIDWVNSFESPALDDFFRLESQPQSLERIREILELPDSETPRLLPLLTQDDAAPPPESPTGAQVRLRYFGHACVLVEWKGVSILTDPWLGMATPEGVEHLSYQDLPEKIDFALITHAHHDHFVAETLLRLRHKIECLVVPRTFSMFYADTSLRLMAQKMGFKNVMELEALDSIKLPDGEITAIPFLGEHADLAHGKVGYIVRAGKQQILFAADSNCLEKRIYEHIRKVVGPIETVFLGMECVGAPLSWMYGTFLPSKLQRQHDQSRRTKGCNARAALDLLETVGSKRVYIYAMGREPWLQYSMGLGLSETSVQVQESNIVLASAREQGFVEAQRPFIKYETYF